METLVRLDHALFWFINSHHAPAADLFWGLVTHLGNAWVVAPLLICLTLIKIPRRCWLPVLLCGTLCLGVGGLINSAIKQTVNRPRPLLYFETLHAFSSGSAHCAVPEEEQSRLVRSVGKKLYHRSFPSGHTNTAFGAAMFAALIFGGWSWALLGAALLVAWSRVYLGVHFPLDTVAGALLGCAISAATVALFIRARVLPRARADKTA